MWFLPPACSNSFKSSTIISKKKQKQLCVWLSLASSHSIYSSASHRDAQVPSAVPASRAPIASAVPASMRCWRLHLWILSLLSTCHVHTQSLFFSYLHTDTFVDWSVVRRVQYVHNYNNVLASMMYSRAVHHHTPKHRSCLRHACPGMIDAHMHTQHTRTIRTIHALWSSHLGHSDVRAHIYAHATCYISTCGYSIDEEIIAWIRQKFINVIDREN